MDGSTKREPIQRYITAYNHFDIEGMLAVLAPDVGFENYSHDLGLTRTYSTSR